MRWTPAGSRCCTRWGIRRLSLPSTTTTSPFSMALLPSPAGARFCGDRLPPSRPRSISAPAELWLVQLRMRFRLLHRAGRGACRWVGPPGLAIAALALLTLDEPRSPGRNVTGPPAASSRFLPRNTRPRSTAPTKCALAPPVAPSRPQPTGLLSPLRGRRCGLTVPSASGHLPAQQGGDSTSTAAGARRPRKLAAVQHSHLLLLLLALWRWQPVRRLSQRRRRARGSWSRRYAPTPASRQEAAAAALTLLACSSMAAVHGCSPMAAGPLRPPCAADDGGARVMARLLRCRAGGYLRQRPQRRGQLGPCCLAGDLLPASVRGASRPDTQTRGECCPSHREVLVFQTRPAMSSAGGFGHQVMDG